MTKNHNYKPIVKSAKESLATSIENTVPIVEWSQFDEVMSLINEASSRGLTRVNYLKGLTSETWKSLYKLGYELVNESSMPLNCYSIRWDSPLNEVSI